MAAHWIDSCRLRDANLGETLLDDDNDVWEVIGFSEGQEGEIVVQNVCTLDVGLWSPNTMLNNIVPIEGVLYRVA